MNPRAFQFLEWQSASAMDFYTAKKLVLKHKSPDKGLIHFKLIAVSAI